MLERMWNSDECISFRAALDWAIDGIGEYQGDYKLGLALDACRLASVPFGATTIYGSLKVMRLCSLFGVGSEKYDQFVEEYRR